MRSTVGKLVALWAAALPTASAFTPLARVGTAPHSVRVTGAPATFAAPPISAQVSSRSGPIVAMDTVVAADFKLALGFAAAGALILALPVIPGGFCLLFGLFLVVQTLRIRFVFDDEAFEVKTKELDQILSPDAALANTGENFVVGGANRWAYSSFVNWDFFPSEQLPSEQTPPLHAVSSSARSLSLAASLAANSATLTAPLGAAVLVYFKETQTPRDKWEEGPGKWANSAEAQSNGAVPGQVHFFPCIADATKLKEQFIAKGCAKL